MSAQQGHDFRGFYYHEDNGFASAPTDSTAKAFGADATIDRKEGTNNAVEVFEPATRVPIDIIERVFEGSFSVSFTYTNPWWLNFIYGAPSTTDNADGSYTHTWSGEGMQSQQIVIGREASTKETALKGCVAATASANIQVNGNAEITIEGAYAEEEETTPGSLTAQPSIDEKPMTFADASLSIAGSSVGYVQQGSVQVQTNAELINEWGTRTAIDFAPRPLIPSLSFTKINESGQTDQLQKMYGSAGSTTIQSDVTVSEANTVQLDNGASPGSGINRLTLNLSGSFPDSVSESGLGDPQADLEHQVNRMTESLSVDATNEVSTAV